MFVKWQLTTTKLPKVASLKLSIKIINFISQDLFKPNRLAYSFRLASVGQRSVFPLLIVKDETIHLFIVAFLYFGMLE